MAHPRELITKIADLLAVEYPTTAYSYIYEKPINEWFRKQMQSKMSPDITILAGNKPVCVVEIGYTRPEKLTMYRETLRIPDVRWYAKDGTLHADVQERVVSVSVTAEPTGPVYQYELWDNVAHYGCPENEGIRRIPERCVKRFIRLFGDRAYLARQDGAEEGESYDVHTIVLTDYIAVWLPTYCDKCGESFMADEMVGFYPLEVCAYPPRQIADCLGARKTISWKQARELVEGFGLALHYMDGHFINPKDAQNIYLEAHTTR